MTDEQIATAIAACELAITARDTSVFEFPMSAEGRTAVPDLEEVEAGLLESGRRRMVAEALRGDAMLDAAGWTRAARMLGIPVARIARLAGLSRHTVYALTPEHPD